MADIFISYKSERRAAAWHLSQILELNGYTVWYDYGLLSGRDFSRRIEKELRAAKAVIVLWCPLSRDSDWVNNEALLARRLKKYIPVWIEETELPLEFIRDDTIDLKRWNGSPRSHDLDRLWDEIARLTEKDQTPDMRGIRQFEATWRGYGALSMTQFSLELSDVQPQNSPFDIDLKKVPPIDPHPKLETELPDSSQKQDSSIKTWKVHTQKTEVKKRSKPVEPDYKLPLVVEKAEPKKLGENIPTTLPPKKDSQRVPIIKTGQEKTTKLERISKLGSNHNIPVRNLEDNQKRPFIVQEEQSLSENNSDADDEIRGININEKDEGNGKAFFLIVFVLVFPLILWLTFDP